MCQVEKARRELVIPLGPNPAKADELWERCCRDVKATQRVQHSGLARILDCQRLVDRNDVVIMTEFVLGETLQRRMEQGSMEVGVATDNRPDSRGSRGTARRATGAQRCQTEQRYTRSKRVRGC
mmetsp:Transcript_44585/g.96633  ORF Transcript_44585/g.96633 Transcript_44585/m.96633 type:complete len:124 (+) Transcript_44585:87-458(+)